MELSAMMTTGTCYAQERLGEMEGRARSPGGPWSGPNARWLGMAPPTQWSMSLGKLRRVVNDRGAWHAAAMGVAKTGHN